MPGLQTRISLVPRPGAWSPDQDKPGPETRISLVRDIKIRRISDRLTSGAKPASIPGTKLVVQASEVIRVDGSMHFLSMLCQAITGIGFWTPAELAVVFWFVLSPCCVSTERCQCVVGSFLAVN